MAVTLESPNPGNYRIGKGNVYFMREGTSEWKHMGNCSSFAFTPAVETLDHFSSMAGIRTKDASEVIESGGEIALVLDEWTAANLALALLGTLDENAVGGPEIAILAQSAVEGQLKFESNNASGPKWNITFYRVSFVPDQALEMISEEWGEIELTGDVLLAASGELEGQAGLAKLVNLDSVS